MASLVSEALGHLVSRAGRSRYADCTVPNDTDCLVETSYYFYRVSLAANAAFLALFTISFFGYIGTWAATRRATAFTVTMFLGVGLEICGYVGRILSNKNQWQETGFLMQIVCLTIAPAFMAAGIYFCLRRIVYAFGPENSRISPEGYTRIFIPCDLASLLLQAAGGGIASAKAHQNEDPSLGNNIMIAGLAIQVLTLFVFMGICVDFGLRTYKRYKAMGEDAFDQNPIFKQLREGWRFKGFIYALTLATICIFWRSTYRVVELGEGWTGHLIKQQWLFVGFEGVMVIVACLALNFFNPAFTFKEAMVGQGGLGAKRRERKQRKQQEKAGVVEQRSASASASEVEASMKQTV